MTIPSRRLIRYRRLRSESSREVFSTILDWTDHIGVAAFSVIGSMNAIRALGGVRLAIVPHCVIAGVMTATFGGTPGFRFFVPTDHLRRGSRCCYRPTSEDLPQ